MITLKEVKQNPLVLEFLKQTEKTLKIQNYTDHGIGHANLVAARARTLALEIGLTKREQELVEIAAFCHDMGNFLSRSHHNYLAALSFQQIFAKDFPPEELALIMQAIAGHDTYQMKFSNPIAAVIVIADKSDVRSSRVTIKDKKLIDGDIHNRVNMAAKTSKLGIDKKKKLITLNLKIDTSVVPIMEYFEIFTERMVFCRKAAHYLNYKFALIINNFKLL